MRFTYRKIKQKPALTPKPKKTWLQWAKEKQLWSVHDWMKAIFSDESRICIGQGDDAGTFVWCRSNEMYKDECLKKTTKPNSFMIWGCRSVKGPGEKFTSTVNALMYIDTFLFPSNEKKGDDFIFLG